MPEAVIVDAIRTPIGRAYKGSLKDIRTDDLGAIPLKALGRYAHEALAIDSDRTHVYLSEDASGPNGPRP